MLDIRRVTSSPRNRAECPPGEADIPPKTVRGPGSAPTFADARRVVAGWSDLSVQQRRRLDSVITAAARICALSPDQELTADFSCAALNATLFQRSPAAHGYSKGRYTDIVSRLRNILRRLGLHAAELRGEDHLSPAWRDLAAQLGKYHATGLAGFMRFCTHEGIEPEAIEPPSIDRFETWLLTRTLTADISNLARRTASNWNRAVEQVQGWPAVRFVRRGMRDDYTPRFEDLPHTFRQDAERYLSGLAAAGDADLYGHLAGHNAGGSHKPLKPRTIEGYRQTIRVAAGALIARGLATDQFTSLEVILTPNAIRDVMLFLRQRTGVKQSTYLLHTAESLGKIARDCRGTRDDLEQIKSAIAAVRPPPSVGMTEKNRDRLRAIVAGPMRGQLIMLPLILADRAARAERSVTMARLMAYAVALEILLRNPVRRENLASLHLDTHFQYRDADRLVPDLMCIDGRSVKNGVTIDWVVPQDLGELLALYLRDFRPLIAAPGNRHLFPGPKDKHRSAHELAIGLCTLVEKEIGAKINAHLLRHFAGWRYLQAHPGDYETVRRMLGHRDINTTVNFYTGLEAEASAQRVDALLRDERAALVTGTRLQGLLGHRRTRRKHNRPPAGGQP